jgi:Holliday junction resolvasome RuvABC endonuclease subunit
MNPATRILGLDAQSTRLGLATFPARGPARALAWTHELDQSSIAHRLDDAYEEAQLLADSRTIIAYELPPLVRGNVDTLRSIERVLGAFLAGCRHAHYILPGFAPGSWKLASVGKGNASKEEVGIWAADTHGIYHARQDALDALGIAHAGRLMWATRREAA